MTFSRTAPRHHITYLRRRPKLGEKLPEPAAPAASGPGLSLGGTSAASAPAQAEREVPRLEDRYVLSRDQPTVVLTRRQSAIGSLVVDLIGGGTLSCAWELSGGEGGLVSATTGTLIAPEFGRRPIVHLLKEGRVVVGLRHVRELRRLLLVAEGVPDAGASRLVAEIHDGGLVETVPAGGRPFLAAVAVYQVGGELILRREDAPFPTRDAATDAYGFSLTWLPPIAR